MNTPVLIVDDSLTVRMDLAQAFEAAGFHPILCASAAEATAALEQTPVDLVILDVVLPDADGVQILARLRDDPATADAVILMLSTEAEVADRVRGLTTGADDYVGKPYDTNYVTAKARELLRTRTAGSAATTVLVIDDSLTFRKTLSRALEADGYQPITAETGEEGLRAAAARRPDAILVDRHLPGIDGPTVIRRLRLDAVQRGVPCLLLTAADDDSAEIQALDAGADAFVRKGDTTIILAKLAAALRTSTRATVGEETASLLGPKRILVVDNTNAYPDLIATALRGDGYDVISATTAAQAMHLLHTQTVDCILLDLRISGNGGPETCRKVKSIPATRHIPLVMTIGRDDSAATVDSLAAGADDVIEKTAAIDITEARIRSHIRRKQFEDENRRIHEEILNRELEAAEARTTRQLAEARAALVRELERKNEELEAFSYSVSHDLRNPIQLLMALHEELLQESPDDAGHHARDILRRAQATAHRMAELINDLLRLSQVSAAALAYQTVDLTAIAHTVLDDLRRREPDRGVTTAIDDDLTAHADPQLMRILFENILGNAWKYTSKTATPTIELGRRHDDDTVFYVRDNGAGFETDQADKLFHPFQRLHTATQFPGTGIGLATAHRIVTRHAGRIWAEGHPGRGATFYFTIPSPTTETDNAPPEPEAETDSGSRADSLGR